MKTYYKLAILLFSCIFSGVILAGPSAKFTATIDDTAIASLAEVTETTVGGAAVDEDYGFNMATIKVPQNKELVVGVSAQVGLLTGTTVKGKNGGGGTSTAEASGEVTIVATPVGGGAAIVAAPGTVIFSKRVQALSATLGGVIESCTDGDLDGTIDVSEDCVVTDEEIGLLLDTTAAHHFNFILPDLPAGEYNIKAYFTTGARADVQITGDGAGSAIGYAVIGKRVITVDEVRATNDGIIDLSGN